MSVLRFLLKVSRPRFWFYIFGPYLIGLVAGAATLDDLVTRHTVQFAIYFLFPANLLIYGINDIFDHETDKLNEKKAGYELLVDRERHLVVWLSILMLNLPFIAAALLHFSGVWLSLASFLFFSVFYSAPPIRAKAIPFLDSAFNILYVFPGAFAYQMMTGEFPSVILMLAAAFWTAAMHAYSAIPDIDADREAGLQTIATFCGPYLTLGICAALYAAAAIVAFPYLGFVSVSLGSIYLIMMAASAQSVRTGGLLKLYRAFPLINVLAGFMLFWTIALQKFF